ncbi:MAG: hypothetical protein AAGC68_06160 [Verrucomicrobiota bacterium]
MSRFLRLVAIMGLTVSCSDSGPSGSEIVIREVPEDHRDFRIVETSAERFRYQIRNSEPEETEAAAGGPRLIYDTPENWSENPPSMMRDINLSFGENGEGECYVARLPGAGGGLAANINRWRGQMGAAPLSEDEIAALPTKPLFGQPATFLSVDGDFNSGMGTTETKLDYRLVGLILSSNAGAVFVKMTGPRMLVQENESSFHAFVDSIDVSLN